MSIASKKRTHHDFSFHLPVKTRYGFAFRENHVEKSNTGTKFHFISSHEDSPVTAVTGEFGNWIFNGDIMPEKGKTISTEDWVKMATESSAQQPQKFAPDMTQDVLMAFMDTELTDDEIFFLEGCIASLDEEVRYRNFWQQNAVGQFKDMPIIITMSVDPRLEAIMDAFDVICEKLENPPFV